MEPYYITHASDYKKWTGTTKECEQTQLDADVGEMGGSTPAYPNLTTPHPPLLPGSEVPVGLATQAERLFSSASLFYVASSFDQETKLLQARNLKEMGGWVTCKFGAKWLSYDIKQKLGTLQPPGIDWNWPLVVLWPLYSGVVPLYLINLVANLTLRFNS